LAPGGSRSPPGNERLWRLAGTCAWLAPGGDGLLRLALALCRQALPVDIFALLLAIPGHSFVWIFGQSFQSINRHKNED